jgi:hypothetical protein
MGGIDNIIAALILSLAMMRRLEVISVERADNPQASDADFARWRTMALRAYNFVALVSLVKVIGSYGWFWLFQGVDRVLQIGGLVIFVAWAGSLVWAWRQATEARALRDRLGIKRRGRSS